MRSLFEFSLLNPMFQEDPRARAIDGPEVLYAKHHQHESVLLSQAGMNWPLRALLRAAAIPAKTVRSFLHAKNRRDIRAEHWAHRQAVLEVAAGAGGKA